LSKINDTPPEIFAEIHYPPPEIVFWLVLISLDLIQSKMIGDKYTLPTKNHKIMNGQWLRRLLNRKNDLGFSAETFHE